MENDKSVARIFDKYTIEKLKQLSRLHSSLFNIPEPTLYKKVRILKNRHYNKTNLINFYNEIPAGIYTSFDQIIELIKNKKSTNIRKSTSYSTLHTASINTSLTTHCNSISYKNTHIISGRDNEISKISLTLSKTNKRACMIVGEAGTGKTTVVEGFNSLLIEQNVPDNLKQCRIYNMNLGYILTHNKNPVEVIIDILEAASKDDTAILFIDEIHMIMNPAAQLGNIIKPYLTSKIRIIGATTTDEYFNLLTIDSALERRFTIINVEEPDINQTINMLINSKSKFETSHNLIINDDIIKYCVNLGQRFLGTRRNPDKSVDILDIASTIQSNSKKSKSIVNKTNNYSENLITLDDDVDCIKNTTKDIGDRNLSKESINKAIEFLTNLDNSIIKDLDYNYILEVLNKHIFGQNDVINNIANVISFIQKLSPDRKKPLATLGFVGTSGVGKTEVAKQINNLIYGDDKNIIIIDMSSYISEHMISEFKGSPPGYVGHDRGGMLIKLIREKPHCILVFKNFNKAHDSIQTYIMNSVKNGLFADTSGRKVKLNNTIVIYNITLSENAFNRLKPKSIGFTSNMNKNNDTPELKSVVDKDILSSVELLFEFNKLTKQDLEKIYENNIDALLTPYNEIEIDRNKLKCDVLKESNSGHDVLNQINIILPKMAFNNLRKINEKSNNY